MSPVRSRLPARWQLLVVGLLLAAMAGWQGWHCASDGMSTSPAALVLTGITRIRRTMTRRTARPWRVAAALSATGYPATLER